MKSSHIAVAVTVFVFAVSTGSSTVIAQESPEEDAGAEVEADAVESDDPDEGEVDEDGDDSDAVTEEVVDETDEADAADPEAAAAGAETEEDGDVDSAADTEVSGDEMDDAEAETEVAVDDTQASADEEGADEAPEESDEDDTETASAPVAEAGEAGGMSDSAQTDPGVDETDDERLNWNFRLTSELHSSDNVGLRELDEESGDQERIETDDRHTFSYTSIFFGVDYEVVDDTRIVASASHNGLWGSDQLGGTNQFDSFFFVYDLHIDWDALDLGWMSLNTKIGRQFFGIGGTHRDYLFSDLVDGLTLEADFGEMLGTLRILGIDLYASQGRPDNVNFLQWHTGRDLVYNMRGQTNTFRYGGIYENTELIDNFEFRGFGFYSTIGGAGTGGDRTHEGTLGNFADNDFAWMTGTRSSYHLPFDSGRVGIMGEYAYSGGIDRKEINIGVPDVEIDGHAFGGALLGEVEFADTRVDGVAQYFRADGPEYGEDGLRRSHGFVSFRGNYAGGLNQSRYGGWRPSAYLGREGIHHSEHDIQRESGTQLLHAGVGLSLPVGLRLDVGAWQYWDTGGTLLDEDDRQEAGDQLPSGYSRDELDAQDRLGRDLGTEINASLAYQANDALSIYGIGGLFIPGSFYEHEVSRNVGSSRGSSDNLQDFWAVTGGATLNF